MVNRTEHSSTKNILIEYFSCDDSCVIVDGPERAHAEGTRRVRRPQLIGNKEEKMVPGVGVELRPGIENAQVIHFMYRQIRQKR